MCASNSQVTTCGIVLSVHPNKMQRTSESSIVKSGSILILHLKRFECFQRKTFKNTQHVDCLPCNDFKLKVPIMQGDIVSQSEYSLVATINHSGTLNAGHYWAYIKEGATWLECNDSSVLPVKQNALNNKSCYVLFFVKSCTI